MQTTSLGFKKPDLTDNADLTVFIGDNMDLIDLKFSSSQPKSTTTIIVAASNSKNKVSAMQVIEANNTSVSINANAIGWHGLELVSFNKDITVSTLQFFNKGTLYAVPRIYDSSLNLIGIGAVQANNITNSWLTCYLSSPVQLTANQNYYIGVYAPTGGGAWSYTNTAARDISSSDSSVTASFKGLITATTDSTSGTLDVGKELLIKIGYIETSKLQQDVKAADYVCTGANDQEIINNALSSLPVITTETGTAQSGSTTSTIKLGTSSLAIDKCYTGYVVSIVSGTGAGQEPRLITSYTGSTRVANISPNWTVTPDATTVYSLSTTCGRVLLLEGEYIVSNAISIPNNCTLEGQGSGTVLKIVDGSPTAFNVVQNDDRVNGNVGITVYNLAIDGNKGKRSGTPTQYGISFIRCSYCKISNNTIMNMSNLSISLNQSCTHNMISENTSIASLQGIFLENSSQYNFVSENLVQGQTSHGIVVQTTSTHNIISNNRAVSNAGHGIYVDSSYTNVTSNLSYSNTSSGIIMNSSSYSTIAGNSVYGNGSSGIVFSTICTVVGNIIQGNTLYGIYANGASNATIVGNTVQGSTQHGIFLSGAVGCVVNGNTCIENSQATNNTYSNIILDASSNYNNVQGNTCRQGALTNKPAYGIRINNVNCTGNFVVNNDLYTGGTTAYSDAGTSTNTTAGNRNA